MDLLRDRYRNFSLRVSETNHLLPEGQELVADRFSGSVTFVDWKGEQFITSCRFSDTQFPVILILLESWPNYTPYEALLPLLDEELKDQEVEEAESAELTVKFARIRESGRPGESEEQKRRIEEARKEVEPILRPLRDLLEDCQMGLSEFGLSIRAVLDYGYLLTRSGGANSKRRARQPTPF
ncbi:MAG TPA: hypothetical protein VFA10_27235 [Ktedonobacteraceae bacterium]|nr:hypothetical protein [Ktedonobacteraceae bacterium]